MKNSLLLLSLILPFLLCSSASAEEMRAVKEPPVYRILSGDRPWFDYRYTETAYKPYVAKFYTPSGINILRDSPSDHVHHHAMMLALMVDGDNFWEEDPAQKPGKQVTQTIEATSGQITSTIDWIKHDGETVATEKRILKPVVLKEVSATILDWCSVFTCAEGREKVDISGRHYFGLGLRFVESMDRDGRFFFEAQSTNSQAVRGDERVTPARWAAYTARVDGKPVTVALFDSPQNPIPMHAFTMGDAGSAFAYLSATFNLHRTPPLELKTGKPLALHWGVALWDGEATPAQVEAGYQAWVGRSGFILTQHPPHLSP